MPPEILNRAKQLVEPSLISAVETLSDDIAFPVKYHFGWVDESGATTEGGGKGIRPALAILSAEFVGADTQLAIPGAVAVELVHNFSLIHDDVIDKDPERRHRATVWKVFGLEDAILAGDALLALAFQILLDTDLTGKDNASLAATELAQATSAMIAGQRLDMAIDALPSFEKCQIMESQKTGALLACSSSIGAILAGADIKQVNQLRTYGMELGLGFQAIDDLLGIWGDPSITGKPAGNDIQENKRSLPIVIALENLEDKTELLEALNKSKKTKKDISFVVAALEEAGAREATQQTAKEHLKKALETIKDNDTQASQELRELAEFVTSRDF